jgi:scyllo-inositol 2-dehydrogenase (NADP+)
MYQPIKTGLLAYGMSGRLFQAPFLHHHKGFNFHAVTERHEKKAKLLYPRVISYDTVDELIQDPAIELVIVNTPNDTHFEFAKKALLAGKHVLIEKPLATSVKEVRELYDISASVNRKVMAYQNRRWDSDFQSVKSIVESGILGKLVEVHFRFDRYRPLIENKAFKESPVPGSGLAYNLGPHLLDQMLYLFGKPERFYKSTAANRTDSKVDDYFFFHCIYPGNMHVYIHGSLLVPRPLPAFVLHGASGSYIKDRMDVQEMQLNNGITPGDKAFGLELPGGEGELTLFNPKGEKHTRSISAPAGNYNQLFDAVFDQIRFDCPYPITENHILWQMEILEQKDN